MTERTPPGAPSGPSPLPTAPFACFGNPDGAPTRATRPDGVTARADSVIATAPSTGPTTTALSAPAAAPATGSAATPLASRRPDGLPAALLCDMDGTLIDTEGDWFAVEVEVMAAHGFALSAAERAAMLGRPMPSTVAHLRSVSELDIPPEQLHLELNRAMVERLAGSVAFLPGAQELLTEARAAGVRTALVTASETTIVEAVLGRLGRHWFDTVVAAEDVTCGKPHPEPYQLAAARLDCKPGECVAIEDSPTGVAAARAAGCRVLAVPRVVAITPEPGLRVAASLSTLTLADLAAPW